MERVENASAFLKGHVHRKQENNQEKSTTAAEENDDTFSEVDSGVDAEGEDVDDEYDDYARRDQTHLDRHIFEGQTGTDMNMNPSSPSVEGMSSAEDEENSIDTKSSTDTDSRWEAPSDVVEEADFETLERSCCTFCGNDEDHDPSTDFEECLECVVCRNIAHQQCARDNGVLHDKDLEHWRCNDCVRNGLHEETKVTTSKFRRRSSAPRLTRDLLPASRGSTKPDSHSVFNTLILDDDPMDGSRSLRKRKVSGDELEEVSEPEMKRRRHSDDIQNSFDDIQKSTVGGIDTTDFAPEIPSIRLSARNLSAAPMKNKLTRSSRRQRDRRQDKINLTIRRNGRYSIMASFKLDATRLKKMLKIRPRKRRRRNVREASRRLEVTPEEPSHYPALQMSSFMTPFFTSHDRMHDDLKSKPYGGILDEVEADTSKTYPLALDRQKFEDARQKAEEEWKQKIAAKNSDSDRVYAVQKIAGPPSKIRCINFGGYEIDTWHAAPYPEEYSRNRVLYICEFCLKYMSSDYVAWRHNLKCAAKHPPGDEIYRNGKFSFFEVDGRKNPVYCQNLCLLAKLFLGSKTLYYDVEPFLFYVMTENDEFGCHFVGYFSKEKRPSSLNNVSCILVLPIHQRRGFGHFLIDFSYLLTRMEKKAGSPEKPLSDMGLVSYRSYWRLVLCYQLRDQKAPISITDLSERTGMTADDIVAALEALRALVKDPVTGIYALRVDHAYSQKYVAEYERKGYCKINAEALVWTPYVMGRTDLANYEEGPSLQTVAPRDEGHAVTNAEEGVQIAELGVTSENNARQDTIQSGEEDDQTPLQRLDEPLAQSLSFKLASRTISYNLNSDLGDGLESFGEIPPSRFMVWPPISGRVVSSASRRRPGRPFGSRRRTFTPGRRRRRTGTAFGSPRSVLRKGAAQAPKSKLGLTVNNPNWIPINDTVHPPVNADGTGYEVANTSGKEQGLSHPTPVAQPTSVSSSTENSYMEGPTTTKTTTTVSMPNGESGANGDENMDNG